VEELFAHPRHPYTLGLMESVPRIDAPRHDRLRAIEGMPPDLIDSPPGCPFLPRCPYAVDESARVVPALEPVAPDHWVACWVDVQTASRHEPASARR
jgi:oligopeptide transport system ATP-binding protein